MKRSKEEIATIDVDLVTVEDEDGNEFGFDTSNKIEVKPQIESEDAVKLIVKGVLRAQKAKTTTLTGNEITLIDTVFNPELVLLLQGGTITYDEVDTSKIVGYTPPVVGSSEKGKIFKLNAYSAQYTVSGQVKQYEKITYPNCQGQPISFGSEDGTFRESEYVIESTPNTGEAPYVITYVESLPAYED